MRAAVLSGVCSVMLFTAMGCGPNQQSEKSGQPDRASGDVQSSGAAAEPAAPTGTTAPAGATTLGASAAVNDCVPDESAGNRRCRNLLSVGWKVDLAALRDSLEKMPTRSAFNRVERQSDEGCRKNNGNKRRTLDVLLKAPVALDVFPRAGTGSRELVVWMFDVSREDKCQEYLYGVRRDRGQSRKTIEFAVATTNPALPPDGTTKKIGSWQSYALIWKETGSPEYELRPLTSGNFMQCGHVHKFAEGDVAFISCSGARLAAERADSAPSPANAYQSLIAGVMKRDRMALAVTQADPFVDPAWGRCGSMGCCSSEATARE